MPCLGKKTFTTGRTFNYQTKPNRESCSIKKWKGEPRIETATRARRKEEIIKASVIEFCGKGYDRAKMEEIARRVGIGKSTVYEYFPSKLELLTATGEYFLDGMLLDMERMLNTDRPVRQALGDYLEYISSVMGTLGINFLHLVGDQAVTEVIHSLCVKYMKSTSEKLIGILRYAQDTGEISPDANIWTAVSLLITIPNPPFIKLTAQSRQNDPVNQLLDLLFSGLSPR